MLKYYLILLLPLVNGKFRFDNYALYKIYPETVQHVQVLEELQNDFRFDFWKYPSSASEYVNIMSSPDNKADLETLLNQNKMRFEITMSNIQENIEKETTRTYERGNIRNMTWDSYYTNDDINAWLDDLVAAHPNIVTPLVIGQSIEGRNITGIKISHGEGRRGIFIEGGLHAREWISPAVTCYITNELLHSTDEATQAAAREYDWYIFPVTNPDGYTWSYTQFRMWRKNRRPHGNGIFGVDLNRNWNDNWLAIGASINPLSDIYAGPGPFSEPETRSLSRFIRTVGDQLDIYLTMHSFGQMILIPFGNTTQPLANYEETVNVGRRATGALAVRHNTRYVSGIVAEVLSAATGAADDWVKERVRVPIVYCYELRDTGTFGFILPPDQILASGEETMDSILDIIHQARRFGVIITENQNSSTSFNVSFMLVFVSFVFSLINK